MKGFFQAFPYELFIPTWICRMWDCSYQHLRFRNGDFVQKKLSKSISVSVYHTLCMISSRVVFCILSTIDSRLKVNFYRFFTGTLTSTCDNSWDIYMEEMLPSSQPNLSSVSHSHLNLRVCVSKTTNNDPTIRQGWLFSFSMKSERFGFGCVTGSS